MKAKLGVVFLLVTFLMVPFSPVSVFAQEKAAPQTDVAQASSSGTASAAAGGTAGAGGAAGLSTMAIAGIAVGLVALAAVVVAGASERGDGVGVPAQHP
jgi:hypothetical protein